MFETNPKLLQDLLKNCHTGVIQLPDFQRSWVWDIDRIVSLIASVSRSFPVGALMTLETGGVVEFKPRPVEGAPVETDSVTPSSLLLDGQQRMTSLYQVTLRGKVVETETAKHKPIKRWFYFDMKKALDPSVDRENAIIPVPEDKKIRSDFGRVVDLDLSTIEAEFEHFMFPLTQVFDQIDWLLKFNTYWQNKDAEAAGEATKLFSEFRDQVLNNFSTYHVPVITLSKETSKEAVCLVFEKVNTGGKPLDAFELITAMYAADGYQLRDDWFGGIGVEGVEQRFRTAFKAPAAKSGILSGVGSTDFFHVISLFYTRELRRKALAEGKTDKELPQVTGKRQALLNLPLSAYLEYKQRAENGFIEAAKFLHMLHIYRLADLPYQSQIIPLAAILSELGESWSHSVNKAKLIQWFWNGVFGELYGSTTESRIAKDFIEVVAWVREDGPAPTTVIESQFRADRLKTMRMRLSAAYKGMNALLMLEGTRDFRTGQKFDHTVFFGEDVDIHHIFPQDWCKKQGIPSSVYDSIINKTPLSAKTNRIIGGAAPSEYLAKLEQGSAQDPAIQRSELDEFLRSHLIDVDSLRRDDFEMFMQKRQQTLLELIETATGKQSLDSSLEVSPDWGVDLDEEFITETNSLAEIIDS